MADAEEREQELPIQELEKLAFSVAHTIDAADLLAPRSHIHVIAEIKRASPSKGRMAEIQDAAQLATIYETSGASAISVLTEQRQFLGSLDDLRQVRQSVVVPLLRKDFIASEYQILEAKAFGANLILLIAAWLSPARLQQLKNFAEAMHLTVLVEAHTAREVQIAVDSDARIIGINARDLATFETDRGLFEEFANLIPSGTTKVAESAVRNADDVRNYKNAGANAVLVGEALVTGDAASLIRSFTEI